MPRVRFVRAIGFAVALLLIACSGEAAVTVPQSAFDSIGEDAFAQHLTPGFSFAVVSHGKLVYARGFGVADIARRVPVTPATRFAIGSLSKQFTAAAILMLERRRHVDVNDPLANYLPNFPNAANITVLQLLNQTSGIHNYPSLKEHAWPLSGPVSVDRIVSLLATDTADFAPGTQWAYSNSNYALLSKIVEQRSDTDLGTFFLRNIFEPLKMHDTGYGDAMQRLPGIAPAYTGRGTFERQTPIGLDLYAGAGAVVSSAVDLSAWDIALLDDTILDRSDTDALWRPGRLNDGSSTQYGMGFMTAILAGHREVWHNGLAPGAGGYCFNALFPDDKLAVIVLGNGENFQGVPESIVARVLALYDPKAASEAVSARPPSPAPGEDPAATQRAKDWLQRLRTGTVDLSQVSPTFAQRLTPSFLADIQAGLANAGDATDWIFIGSKAVSGATISNYWIRLGGVPRIWSVGITPDGKIAGSLLK